MDGCHSDPSDAAIRRYAELRLGELINEQRESVGLNRGTAGVLIGPGRGKRRVFQERAVSDPRPTLAQAGIGKALAHRARTLGILAISS